MDWEDCEGLANDVLDSCGIPVPVDPWMVAWALGLEVRTGPASLKAGCLIGDRIFVNPRDRLERQGFTVAHECAHYLCDLEGIPHASQTERVCDALASCLLLPRIDFTRDTRRTGGCLFALKALHPWASHEALVRRLVSIMPGVAWVWDCETPSGSRRPYSIVTPGQRWPYRRPTRDELDAIDAAIETRAPAESCGGVRAWPVFEPGFARVISLASIDVFADCS